MTDLLDRAQALEEQQRQEAINHAKSRRYKQVMEKDGHRHCIDCGIEINTKRLMANPDAERCIDCQGLHESQSKHFRGR